MTAPNLTPAEALEVFRDCRAVERADMLTTTFYDKWGTFDNAMLKAIIALEAAIAKLAALEAKPVEPAPVAASSASASIPEPVCAKCHHPKSNHPYRHPFQPTMLSLGADPVAPVPSDEEIDDAFDKCANDDDCSDATYELLQLLAKRIGVKL